MSTIIWRRHLNSSPITSGPSFIPQATPSVRPTLSSISLLLSEGMSLEDLKISKENCAKCSAALRSNTIAERCSTCNKGLH